MLFRFQKPAAKNTRKPICRPIERLEARQLLTGTLTGTLTSTVTIGTQTTFIAVGGTETFQAVITPALSQGPAPTGTVTFDSYTGTYPSQTVAVGTGGIAVLPVVGTTPGYIGFIAQYSGDDNYAPTNASAGTAVVNAQAIQPSLVKNTLAPEIVQGAASSGSTSVTLFNPTDATITAKQTITVSGERYIGGSFDITPIGHVTRNVTLTAGQSKSFTVPVNMKGVDAIAGTYNIVPTVTDSLGETSFEITAGSGVDSNVVVDPAFVDLSATLVTTQPKSGSALPGKTVSATLEIFNNGNVLAHGTSATTFSASSNADGSSAVFVGTLKEPIRILPGKHATFHITKQIPIGSIPGTYFIVANVDTLNALNESDLTNNIAVSANSLTILDPYPNLMGGYTGTYTVKHGVDKGSTITQTGSYTAEDNTTGIFLSTGTDALTSGPSAVSSTGKITITGVYTTEKTAGYTVYYVGRLKNGMIKGSFFNINGDSGTFAWTLTG